MSKSMTKIALAAAVLAGAATSAQAYVFMRIADLAPDQITIQSSAECNTSLAQVNVAGGNCSTVDGFTGYALNGTGIGFNGVVGNFEVFTTSGTSNIPGSASAAFLNTSSTSVENLSADGTGLDTMYIDFRGFNFSAPGAEFKTLFGSASYSGTISGSGAGVQELDTRFYADPSNGGGTAVADDCVRAIVVADACDSGTPVMWSDVPGSSFSLRSQQYFSIVGATITNATTSVVARPAPEPMTVSLVSIALLGAGLAARRRARQA